MPAVIQHVTRTVTLHVTPPHSVLDCPPSTLSCYRRRSPQHSPPYYLPDSLPCSLPCSLPGFRYCCENYRATDSRTLAHPSRLLPRHLSRSSEPAAPHLVV